MVEASTYYAKEREANANKKNAGNAEWKTSLRRPKYIEENNTEIHAFIQNNRACGCGVFSTNSRKDPVLSS
jgi:hypothetical protein